VLRWIAAGMGEAAIQFRRVDGYMHLPALRSALEANITVTPCQGGCRLVTHGPPPNFHGDWDIFQGRYAADCGMYLFTNRSMDANFRLSAKHSR
jgi:hypothetical protein